MSELNTKLIQLTEILSDLEFHDGDSLGNTLNITRSAVWKMIKKLSDYGVKITSIKGKGYALDEPLALMNKDEILSKLPKKLTNHLELSVFETISSTNDYLKEHYNSYKTSICISECQKAGKGRLNRNWYSPFGKNIYLSARYRIEKDISELGGLTFAISVATMNTLKKFGLDPKIKWPNDIYCNQKKISGNLIEIFAESNSNADAIIGIGLNANMNDIDTDAELHWTSISRELNKNINRNDVAAELIIQLNEQIEIFKTDGMSHFRDIILINDFLHNARITVTQKNKKHTGVASGIDPAGRLILKQDDGNTTVFSSGDAHILL